MPFLLKHLRWQSLKFVDIVDPDFEKPFYFKNFTHELIQITIYHSKDW